MRFAYQKIIFLSPFFLQVVGRLLPVLIKMANISSNFGLVLISFSNLSRQPIYFLVLFTRQSLPIFLWLFFVWLPIFPTPCVLLCCHRSSLTLLSWFPELLISSQVCIWKLFGHPLISHQFVSYGFFRCYHIFDFF